MSQKKKILAYLRRGKSLTVLTALKLFGCFSLSQRIGNLKVDGHSIDSETITLPNGKRISKYFIKK